MTETKTESANNVPNHSGSKYIQTSTLKWLMITVKMESGSVKNVINTFLKRVQSWKHIKIKYPVTGSFKCEKCPKMFEKWRKWNIKFSKSHSKKLFQYYHCPKIYQNRASWEQHIDIIHNKLKLESGIVKSVKNTFVAGVWDPGSTEWTTEVLGQLLLTHITLQLLAQVHQAVHDES